MQIKEILSFASLNLVKEQIEDYDAVAWVNDALFGMGVDAKRITTTTITCDNINKWYDLPADAIMVHEVYDDQGNLFRSFVQDQSRIKFAVKDTYSVDYYCLPTMATSVEDTPDCHTLLHYPLAYYIAARQIEPRTENEANIWLAEYGSRLEKALRQLSKKPRRIVAGYWR